jgi:hypothetical protein
MATKEYALYKGDELLSIGTIKQIADMQGVHENTIRYYNTAAYRRKLSERKKNESARILIEIEDDEVEK